MHVSIFLSALISVALSSPIDNAQAWKHLPKCDEHVTALASGIHLNIQGQYAEYNGTVKLLGLACEKPFDKSSYLIAKGELISDIQAGMNIRAFNQAVAPKNSPALPGLAKYQAAQQPEAAIAKGLTGNPSVDRPNLETLKGDVLQGIKLNEMNLKNVSTLIFEKV